MKTLIYIKWFLLLEWLYPEGLPEQEKLNRLFLSAVVILCVTVVFLATWMWRWDTETQARREATNQRIEQWKEQVRQYELRKAEQDSIVGEWKERNK